MTLGHQGHSHTEWRLLSPFPRETLQGPPSPSSQAEEERLLLVKRGKLGENKLKSPQVNIEREKNHKYVVEKPKSCKM